MTNQTCFFAANDYSARRAIIEAAHDSALEFNWVLDNFPKHWPEYETIKHWCQHETTNVICYDSRARAVLHMADMHAEALGMEIGTSFVVLVGVRQHRITVELRLGQDGIYWALNAGTCLKSEYSAEDIAEQARLNSLTGVKHGDIVIINGEQYRTHVNGNYSDAAVFHKA